MEIDFKKDLKLEIERIITEYGYKPPSFQDLKVQDKRDQNLVANIADYDLQNLLLHFFTVRSRRIPIKKWQVHISPELKTHPNYTLCKPIVEKLKNGEDVNNLLSKKVKKTNQKKSSHTDLLLYEWGIYHLHFSEAGSDNLLFVFLNNDEAYFLNILRHEKKSIGNVTWTNTDLIQILHNNWPSTISNRIFRKGSKSKLLTTEQRKTLRQKASNTTVIVSDNTEYLPLGGGFSSSRHPVSSVMQSDRLLLDIRTLEKAVRGREAVIRNALSRPTEKLKIRLYLDDELQITVVEENTRTGIQLHWENA